MRAKRVTCFLFVALISAAAAAPSNGGLPMYPHGHNMNNDMPAAPAGMGVPMVLETDDPLTTVDGWYQTNAPKTCTRTSASGGIKYACSGGSIMIYAHKGKTQIAFVPTMPSFMGR